MLSHGTNPPSIDSPRLSRVVAHNQTRSLSIALHTEGDARRNATDASSRTGTLDGPAYERWVDGYDVEAGQPKGRLRIDAHGLRFVEVVVNGPKSWSLAALLHPEIAAAYDAAR
jgi:hypothetical protein